MIFLRHTTMNIVDAARSEADVTFAQNADGAIRKASAVLARSQSVLCRFAARIFELPCSEICAF